MRFERQKSTGAAMAPVFYRAEIQTGDPEVNAVVGAAMNKFLSTSNSARRTALLNSPSLFSGSSMADPCQSPLAISCRGLSPRKIKIQVGIHEFGLQEKDH
jgi:hypothetical protein